MKPGTICSNILKLTYKTPAAIADNGFWPIRSYSKMTNFEI